MMRITKAFLTAMLHSTFIASLKYALVLQSYVALRLDFPDLLDCSEHEFTAAVGKIQAIRKITRSVLIFLFKVIY